MLTFHTKMDTGTFNLLYSDDDMDLAPTQPYSDGRSIAGVENMETDDDDFWDIISVCDIEHSYFDMYPDPEDFGYDHQAQGNPPQVPDHEDDDNSRSKKTTPNSPVKIDFNHSQRQSWAHLRRYRPTRKQ